MRLVLNLSARSSDDPASFRKGDYTWLGARSIDGKLANDYHLAGGATVSVASDKLMRQYATTLPDQDFEVTITLPAHGRRSVDLPPDAQTVSATEHPDVAAKVGV